MSPKLDGIAAASNLDKYREDQIKIEALHAPLCPLKDGLVTCSRERCAWWITIRDRESCAVVSLARLMK